MALNQFSTNTYPNLVDHAAMENPDGTIARIAWMLSQANDVLKDVIWQQANTPLGHKVVLNTALPQGTWRGNNQGVPSSKPLNAPVTFAVAQLRSYSKVDKTEADLMGDTAAFRFAQDQSHVEGMSQQVAGAFFYSSEALNPQQFTGLSPYYNTTTQATAQTAKNVISGGGSGSSNTSLWLVCHGDYTTYGIYPKGTQAGLVYEDKGDIRELYDANGNGFEGYTSLFEWNIGLAVNDWRFNVRIANLDTTTSGLLGASPPDLNSLMIEAVNKIPALNRRVNGIDETDAPQDPKPGVVPGWYGNRTVRTALDLQAIRDKNVLISMKEYAGAPVVFWRDIPVRNVDQLINSETTVS